MILLFVCYSTLAPHCFVKTATQQNWGHKCQCTLLMDHCAAFYSSFVLESNGLYDVTSKRDRFIGYLSFLASSATPPDISCCASYSLRVAISRSATWHCLCSHCLTWPNYWLTHGVSKYAPTNNCACVYFYTLYPILIFFVSSPYETRFQHLTCRFDCPCVFYTLAYISFQLGFTWKMSIIGINYNIQKISKNNQ